jgi:LysR family cys regulon transcriptional activator
MFIRTYLYDFIRLFAPHLDRDTINHAMQTRDRRELDALYQSMNLPIR